MNAITNQINQRGQNLLAIGRMRQRDQENQRQNALAEKRIGLYEQSNALDQKRFEATQAERKRRIEVEEKYRKNDIISNGLSVAASLGAEKGPVYFENFLKVNGITDGPKVDFSYLKPEGGGTITQEIGGGKWVSVTGTGQQLEAFYKANPKSMAELATVVKGTGVQFSQVNPPKAKKWEPTSKAEAIELERAKKDKTDDVESVMSRNVSNTLNQYNIRKGKNGGYEKVGEDDMGNPAWVPVSQEEAAWAVGAEKDARIYTNAVLKYQKDLKAKTGKDVSYEDASYEFEIEREKHRRKIERRKAAIEKRKEAEKKFKRIDRGTKKEKKVVAEKEQEQPSSDKWDNYLKTKDSAFEGAGIPDVFMQDLPRPGRVWTGRPNAYNARF